MTVTLRILLAIICVIFFVSVVLRVRRGKLLLPYSFVWLCISLLGIIAAVFPGFVVACSALFGFETPSNFVFFVFGLFALASLFHLSTVVSGQTVRIKGLVQEVALLKERMRDVERRGR